MGSGRARTVDCPLSSHSSVFPTLVASTCPLPMGSALAKAAMLLSARKPLLVELAVVYSATKPVCGCTCRRRMGASVAIRRRSVLATVAVRSSLYTFWASDTNSHRSKLPTSRGACPHRSIAYSGLRPRSQCSRLRITRLFRSTTRSAAHGCSVDTTSWVACSTPTVSTTSPSSVSPSPGCPHVPASGAHAAPPREVLTQPCCCVGTPYSASPRSSTLRCGAPPAASRTSHCCWRHAVTAPEASATTSAPWLALRDTTLVVQLRAT